MIKMKKILYSAVVTVLVAYCLILASVSAKPADQTNITPLAGEEEAAEYLKELDATYSEACNKQMISRWDYITNVTNETAEASVKATTEFLAFQASVQKHILDNFADWQNYTDPVLNRKFQFLVIRGPGNMNEELVAEMNELMGKMETAYAETKICDYRNQTDCTLRLEPEIEEKLRTEKDYDALAYYWTAWHDAMSNAVPTTDYARFIELQNMMANETGIYTNMGDLWAAPYDDGTDEWTPTNFEQQMIDIWETLRPYYNKLHAYVRMKLKKNQQYADKIQYGLLPANLMGNMWAQDWTALDESTRPFPEVPALNVTAAMEAKGYNETYMFEVADKFFQDLGLTKMTDTFWNDSMLMRPEDGRDVVCHASAEDFCLGGEDFRIKMCTNVNQEDLVTVHHEMGHIEYFMQYAEEHYIFRDGANPGFHEAIGDALALAVTTPKHLKCVLELPLEVDVDCTKSKRETKADVTPADYNFLYHMALEKFAFFPFAISMDSWRWGVFDGSIPESEYNRKWWEIRQKNQGIEPPSPRSDTGFDPSAKYHIVANVEYIRYFISHILQFQFYEAMCIKAGEYDPAQPDLNPLYQCDFDGSHEAGEVFGKMMKLGFSKSWPEALKELTGNGTMSTQSLLNYFKPLFDYIDTELTLNGEPIGFSNAEEEADAKGYVEGYYEEEASKFCRDASVADFNYQTNLTSVVAENASTAAYIAWANFELEEYETNITKWGWQFFDDKGLSRQLKFMNAIGTSALNETNLQRYNEVLSEMSKIYGTAKVCPYDNQECNLDTEGLTLEPDLTRKLAELQDFNEMAYLWAGWRDASGKKMRELYLEYVKLSNIAAEDNGYKNMGDFWLLRYESDTFREDIKAVYDKVKTDLYVPLYSFVRHRLAKHFSQMDADAMMPAHVLGNMWSQTWENVLPHVLPHPDAASFDITSALETFLAKPEYPDGMAKRKRMFEFANDFFQYLGLENMDMAYGDKAMIMKPEDGREVICHASAWDMCDKEDFRIKMCTDINHNDFITIHHELGHIQYYLNYKNLPITYRTGANPGFHEAIGDVVALSVSTPEHLGVLGFTNTADITDESRINYLMQMALDKIAFLPFGYLIDSYRWQIFDGQIPATNLTYNWLKMRAEFQGILPPFARDETDFDAGAKYHVPANTPYIRYFVSYILQFQIHKKLCEVAGLYPAQPLYQCDIMNNTQAGILFGEILKAGGSENWQDLLGRVTGSSTLDPSAIIEYFDPLLKFLKDQADTEKYPMGWDPSGFEKYYGTEDPVTRGPGDGEPDDDDNNVAAIVVGIVLGVVVLVIVVGYFFGKKCRKS